MSSTEALPQFVQDPLSHLAYVSTVTFSTLVPYTGEVMDFHISSSDSICQSTRVQTLATVRILLPQSQWHTASFYDFPHHFLPIKIPHCYKPCCAPFVALSAYLTSFTCQFYFNFANWISQTPETPSIFRAHFCENDCVPALLKYHLLPNTLVKQNLLPNLVVCHLPRLAFPSRVYFIIFSGVQPSRLFFFPHPLRSLKKSNFWQQQT